MKIKFTMPGQSNSFMKERVIKDFYHGQNATIVDDHTYDVLVICNRITEPSRVPKTHTVGVIMEPSWSPNWDRGLHESCGHIFVHDNSLFNFTNCNILERPSLMFNEFYNSFEYPITTLMQTKFNKTKKMSFVLGGKNSNSNATLYEKRLELANGIKQRNLPIDVYGRGIQADGKYFKGPIDCKIQALIDYEYSIGIENCSEKNYISEKLFDCFLTDTVPIYYGCPNVAEIYEPNSFINLKINELTIDNCLDILETILNTDKNKHKHFCINSKNNYIQNNNLITEILKIYY